MQESGRLMGRRRRGRGGGALAPLGSRHGGEEGGRLALVRRPAARRRLLGVRQRRGGCATEVLGAAWISRGRRS